MKSATLFLIIGLVFSGSFARADYRCRLIPTRAIDQGPSIVLVDEEFLSRAGNTLVTLATGDQTVRWIGFSEKEEGFQQTKTQIRFVYPEQENSLVLSTTFKSCGRGSCDPIATSRTIGELKVGNDVFRYSCLPTTL